MDNAVRHTPAGGRIALELASPAGATVEFAVSDSGPGIASDLNDSVFERFRRDESSGHSGGAGLGLALCAAIVTAHSGSIKVDRRYVTGTRISVRLPVAAVSA